LHFKIFFFASNASILLLFLHPINFGMYFLSHWSRNFSYFFCISNENNYTNLWDTMWRFDTCIYCVMIKSGYSACLSPQTFILSLWGTLKIILFMYFEIDNWCLIANVEIVTDYSHSAVHSTTRSHSCCLTVALKPLSKPHNLPLPHAAPYSDTIILFSTFIKSIFLHSM
jgi:hypothetical protein